MSSKSTQPVTIVHTKSGLCLTTKQFDRWQEVQAAFDDYKASLGPFNVEELLEYLEVEYPTRQPFGRGVVLPLVRQKRAYIWAASELPAGDGLKLGSASGESFRLAVDGFQFPNAVDPRERFSWYEVDGSVTSDGQAWDFRWAALTCDTAPLICSWLFEVASWVELRPRAEAPPSPWLIEPNLQFPKVLWENGRAVLTIELDLEFRSPGNREGGAGAGKPDRLLVRATPEELRTAAVDFAATIARWPTPSGPSAPVKDRSGDEPAD